MTFRRLVAAAAALLLSPIGFADEQVNAELNKMLEDNAASAAYARVCGEEPVSDQLKSNTMMLLTVTGLPAYNVQLGSAKFNDVMRRELAGVRSLKDVDCPGKVREARERLTATQGIIQGSRQR